MSGTGQRFIKAGYKAPKPLIKADGMPIIEHVVALFPGEDDFIFICNSDHLRDTDMREVLTRIAPKGKIVEIPPHKKGPVYAVSQVFDNIRDDEEVIVNYCDFSKYWDYQDFLKHTRNRDADGAIPAYRGFHPHMLGTTNYAFMRDERQWMVEIREKQPFTDDRISEYASDGTYYFKKGSFVKKYFKALMDEDINVGGEYYVSLVYNLLKRDGLSVSIYEIQHMLQWGTPRDLEEYQRWSDYFRGILSPAKKSPPRNGSINLIPLAGRGSRFAVEGYKDPKPLIPVSGRPMVLLAAGCLPPASKRVFVCLGEHLDGYPLREAITGAYPDAKVVRLDHVTEGQAITCMLGLDGEDPEASLLVAACDNGMLYDAAMYDSLINDPSVDAVVWSFRRHPSGERNPKMYGWIRTDGKDSVTGVSVKEPVSDDPYNDHAVVGTFYFRKSGNFIRALEIMQSRNIRVNGEFYVDSMINVLIEMGQKVKVFETDGYICWGTPDDLSTFEYWQSFFHKCAWHPYGMEKDPTFDQEKVQGYDRRYREFSQGNE